MRGQRYQAKDKTVRKMGRDGLTKENLRSGEKTRVSRREADHPALPGTAADSLNLQERRSRRADGKRDGRKRRGGFSSDFKTPGNGAEEKAQAGLYGIVTEEEDSFLYKEDSAETEKDTETVQEGYPDQASARQTEPEAREAGGRQEAAVPSRVSGKKKRYMPEPLAAKYRRQGRNTAQAAAGGRTGFPDTAPENRAGAGTDMAAEPGQAAVHDLPGENLRLSAPAYEKWGHPAGAGGKLQAGEENGQDRAHSRKKKQVYAYARKMKEQKKAEERKAASVRREERRHTKNRLAAGEALRVSGENAEKSERHWRLHKGDGRKTGRLSFGKEDGMRRRLAGRTAYQAAGAAASLAGTGQEGQEEDLEAGILGHAGRAGKQASRYALRTVSCRMQKREHTAGEETMGNKKKTGKFYQKQKIKKDYKKAKRGGGADVRQTGAGNTFWEKVKRTAAEIFRDKKGALAAAAALILLFLFFAACFSGCSAMVQGTSSVFIGTTYPSRDEDIYAAEDAYKALEGKLDERIRNIETEYPGYDEYRYQVDEITHNPYQLISFLTVLYEEFTYNLVEEMDMLLVFFAEQYTLTVEEVIEKRTRTEMQTVTDPETGEETEEEAEVEYEWHILYVCRVNKGFDTVARNHMTQEQADLYDAYNMVYGNRSYLFDVNGLPADGPGGIDYEIPAEALTDVQFARMIQEAEKYLGYPYVWGGDSPGTGFDCSGYVSWVINHCGNGWDVGRQTAEGLRGRCTAVSPSAAKPGDLVFFQGTYNTSGASHVGIYVGNGMMINAGSPVKYSNLNTPYWKGHLLSYGRIG